MNDTDLSPEQASELLEQAQEQAEAGVDAFEQAEAEEPAIEPTPHQNEALDYVDKLAKERAEKLLLQEQLAQAQAQDKSKDQDSQSQEPKEEVDLAKLFGDFDEEGLQRGIDYLVDKKVGAILEQKLAPIEQKQVQDLANEHLNAITAVHPDASDVVNSDDFANWVQSQPSYLVPSIVAVVEQGSASQINELLSNYKATLVPNNDDVTERAKQVLAQTKTPVPNSLSELGGQVVSDPLQAVANMNGMQMSEAIDNWTPEQIENFLNRQL